MKHILILGGQGYIGTALCEYLYEKEHVTNTGIGRENSYFIETVDLEWFGRHTKNIHNYPVDYRNILPGFYDRFDAVVLLAGYSSPAICDNSGGASVIQNNVGNFVSILPKLRKGQKFIYASSITVYTGGQSTEIDEDSPVIIKPSTSLYDFGKQDCDRIMMLYPEIEFYGLRLATVCGISHNWRSDIMVNSMTDNALNTSEVKVFNPRNGKPILYIQDLCRAIEKIIEHPKDARGFYNLASFNGITEEIAEVVADVTNSNLRVLSSSEMAQNNLPNTGYDLKISTKKFEETFDFKFKGTTELITQEIVAHVDDVVKSKRIQGIKYDI